MVLLYRNIKNPHKFIEVKRYDNDYHYMWRQYLDWESSKTRNYTGDGKFHRQSIKTIREVLLDYILIAVTH